MHIRSTLSIAVLVAASVTAMPALAAVTAIATTPLNVRSGPGPQYPVVGVIQDNGRAVVTGCIQGSRWCQVSFNGNAGWAYSKYLAMNQGGQTVVIAQEPSVVPVVPYQAPAATAVETVGSAPAPIAVPPQAVGTYVEAHPVQPVYLNGEVVVGAGLPQSVALAPVPNTQYDYAYVNRVPVLVEPQTRRIVYVYR